MKSGRLNALLSVIATLATLLIVGLLVANIYYAIKEEQAMLNIVLYVSLGIISLFTYGVLQVSFWKGRHSRTIKLVNSINTIDSSQQELFEVGFVLYNYEQIITYISPWLLREGFDGLIGKKFTALDIELNTEEKQIIERGAHKWEVTFSPKAGTILLKDVTSIETLRKIIDSQLKSIVSFHTAFSKKISFNDSVRADATLKVNQTIKEWATKYGGLFNATLNTEGTVTTVVDWRKCEKDIYSESILALVKKANSKLNKDITISIGVSFGDAEYTQLLEQSLKSLEISKNRGGDQIVLANPNGEMEYIGLSTQQAVSGNTLDIKGFHSGFISDIAQAKDIYITSHKMADLDALGSSLGVMQLAEAVNNNVRIILEEFDTTAKKLYDSLPKRIKDKIIGEKEAKKLVSSRAHFVITDTAVPMLTQASNILEDISNSRITIIDHHRLNKDAFEFDESKTLIETSTSSASELVVEMLKISLGSDAQTEIDPFVSTGLLSGIRLDSKQLTKNVTNATFESVAWLMNNEANTTETEALFKPSQSLIKIETEAFSNITKPVKGIIFTYLSEESLVSETDPSLLADKLLSYDGVEATFVLAKTETGKFKLSARSNGNINVQDVAEKLGGGGHFNVAAVTWNTNSKYSTLIKKITTAITKIGK